MVRALINNPGMKELSEAQARALGDMGFNIEWVTGGEKETGKR